MKFFRKLELLFLLLILLGGFMVRLYRFNGPVADWHSWRQADTSAVSRNFVNEGFNILYPKFDDLSNVPSGIYDNPNGYRFVEFPIYNVFQAGFFVVFGHFTLEEWGRLVSIFFSLITTVFIYLICRRYANGLTALSAAFFYAFLPFNVYYGRTILPDQTMLAAILAGIYFFDLWLETVSKKLKLKSLVFFLLAIFCLASALLLKPFAIFFFLPVVWLAWEKFRIKMFIRIDLWILAILSILPLLLWRIWISRYPAGIPQSSWLFNEGNIRFTGAYFHWIFAIRIPELILGYWGMPILVIGILLKQQIKNRTFFLSFLASSLLYVIVVARGNVQHSYYQIPIMSTIAIYLGIGSNFFINPPKEYVSKWASYIIFIVCVVSMLAFSWFEVRDYFNINNIAIVNAGQAVDKLIPKNAKIVAPYGGDTSLLYQTKRKGWASFEKPLPQLITMGADYLLLVNPKPEDKNIGKTYKIVSATADYILFDLRQKP